MMDVPVSSRTSREREPASERFRRALGKLCRVRTKLILFGEASLRRGLSEYTEHHPCERNKQRRGNPSGVTQIRP